MLKVYFYLHTHWDREWHKTFREFQSELIKTFDGVLDALAEDTIHSFYFDGQTIVLRDYLDRRPERKKDIIDFCRSQRLFFGPWTVLADEFLVSGESLVRNLLYGIETARQFHVKDFVGYLPDSFGHSRWIPTLLKGVGINSSIVWRGIDPPLSAFWWEGPDGSTVKTYHLTEGYYHVFFHDSHPLEGPITPQKRLRAFQTWLSSVKKRSGVPKLLLPIGADHHPLPNRLKSKLRFLCSHLKNIKFVPSTPIDFLDRLPDDLPKLTGEFRDTGRIFLLPGVYSSRLYLKKENAEHQWTLARILDPLLALSSANQPSSTLSSSKMLWNLLLENHPHDSICGCSIDAVHRDMLKRYRALRRGITASFRKIFSSVPKGQKNAFVFNATLHPFRGVVHDPTDDAFHFFPSIPPLTTVPLSHSTRPPKGIAVRAENNVIKNGRLVITISKKGRVTVRDLKTNNSFRNLFFFQDEADKGDEYNFCPLEKDRPLSPKFLDWSLEILTPEIARIKFFHFLSVPTALHPDEKTRSPYTIPTRFSTTMEIRAGDPLLRFRTQWINEACDHRFQVRFSTKRISRIFAEDHFGVVERTPPSLHELRRPVSLRHEAPSSTAPMQRFVTDRHIVLFGLGLPEYDAHLSQPSLGITLLRSTGWLSRGNIPNRRNEAGPFIRTGESQCIGKISVEYGWSPFETFEECFLRADLFMNSVRLIPFGPLPQAPFSLSNPAIQLSTLKISEDKKAIIVRLYNTSKRTVRPRFRLCPSFRHVYLSNLLEEPLSIVTSSSLTFQPNEIKTLRIVAD
ncbi:MAG: hypothetical protein D6679_08035 [Candidatus Hydrogenedentota bacterium]|nr:MAG: hypothetical protein D6679_08035 [Candidatus Hydrogenedentota bacterium]